MKKDIYLDGAANTPVDKKVYKAMKPYLTHGFVGNSSAVHSYGIHAEHVVEEARQKCAKLLCFDPSEIYFTSGATEANNWILKGLCLHELSKQIPEEEKKKHLVVLAIEHSSVLSSCRFLESIGFEITYVYPDTKGQVSIRSVIKHIRGDTLLVCAMAVNNETGARIRVNDIGRVAHQKGSLMMSDCTQLVSMGGKLIQLGKNFPNVDYFSFSSHKIYGPEGIGCLIARSSAPLYSFIQGGSQESGMRGGTSNIPGIVGTAKALELMQKDQNDHYRELYNYMLKLLKEKLEGKPFLNVSYGQPNIMNINFSSYFDVDDFRNMSLTTLLTAFHVSCSPSSACDAASAAEDVPSHVLMAQKIPAWQINTCIRISFTKYTKKRDLRIFCDKIIQIKKDRNYLEKQGEE